MRAIDTYLAAVPDCLDGSSRPESEWHRRDGCESPLFVWSPPIFVSQTWFPDAFESHCPHGWWWWWACAFPSAPVYRSNPPNGSSTSLLQKINANPKTLVSGRDFTAHENPFGILRPPYTFGVGLGKSERKILCTPKGVTNGIVHAVDGRFGCQYLFSNLSYHLLHCRSCCYRLALLGEEIQVLSRPFLGRRFFGPLDFLVVRVRVDVTLRFATCHRRRLRLA